MKSFLFAFAALLGATAVAQADSLVCAMKTTGGDTVAYNLSSAGADFLAEDVFVKNGAAIIRKPTDLRPMWALEIKKPYIVLTYQADDSFKILIDASKDVDGGKLAGLFKNGNVLGSGFCKIS